MPKLASKLVLASTLATGLAAVPGPAHAAPTTAATVSVVSPELACDRARLAARDAWRSVESGVQKQLYEARAVVTSTKPSKTRDGVQMLQARLAAVQKARESALLGGVLARDAAAAAGKVIPDATASAASAAEWAACRELSPRAAAPAATRPPTAPAATAKVPSLRTLNFSSADLPYEGGATLHFRSGTYARPGNAATGEMDRDFDIGEPELADLDGDGTEEAIVVITSGPRHPSDAVVVYGGDAAHPKILAELAFEGGAQRIDRLSVSGRKILVFGDAWAAGDPGCCPTLRHATTLVLAGGKLLVESSTRTAK